MRYYSAIPRIECILQRRWYFSTFHNVWLKLDCLATRFEKKVNNYTRRHNEVYAEIRVETRIKTNNYNVEMIPYMKTRDGIVKKYHKMYLIRCKTLINLEAHIQFIKSPLIDEENLVSLGFIEEDEMHEQPSPSSKQVENKEDSSATQIEKNILQLLLDGLTAVE
ncbi:hypothetical protein CWI38_0943p0010 [Hamiltosporidium tvaerminnensis]|uniref:Uncharacterized protein n=1 Tax=Hamiltosporidium tvaerminnensis TaxID=1176355 RepID=A0A4Q9LWI3_9MICR|nr:hypothetical protein CWI38_0943p0010 [Hamiltosporidium tvaerminnensis]